MKTCKQCKKEKPLSEYYQHKEGYYFGKCKECYIAQVRQNRRSNPEKYRELDRQYKKSDKYRKAHRERTRNWWKSEAGREYNRQRCNKRHHSDPEYHNLKRAARAAGSEVSILRVVKNRDGVCRMCGSGENLQFDHIFPQSLGGLGTVDNLQLLCGDCNLFKSNNLLLPEGGMLILSQDLKERLVGEVRNSHPGS